MYRLEPESYLKTPIIGIWGLAAFQAGFINSIGFLACQRFVSHVTGFGTLVGISLGEWNYLYSLELFTAPIFFVIGAWFNGYLTVSRLSRGLTPRYDVVSWIMPSVLVSLMFLGLAGFFGEFGGPLSFRQDFILLNSLTFLCGLQNACFATLTKGQIRTTHLTGISTDFGTDLALLLNGTLESGERQMALRRNWMRFMTFTSFSLGAVISALIDSSLHYWSLLIPIGTSVSFACILQAYKSNHRRESIKSQVLYTVNAATALDLQKTNRPVEIKPIELRPQKTPPEQQL